MYVVPSDGTDRSLDTNGTLAKSDRPWQPAILDRGHDDYFSHPQNGCPDLKDSSFLIPAGTAAEKTAPARKGPS